MIDSIRSDWHVSDDGVDRGPIDQWPAPFLGTDDGSNSVPAHELRRAGSRSGMRFDESSGPIPPQILPRRPGFDFDDGGLNYEEYDQGFARDAFAEERYGDAIFSRTGMGGPISAYRFLRKHDPGSDNTYAPRRGPHDVTSTSAVNAGAGNIPGGTSTDVRSPTRTEVRSPTSTRAHTQGNFTATVTGGAGAGATNVTIRIPRTWGERGGPSSARPRSEAAFVAFSDAAGAGGDRLAPGEVLLRGQHIASPNGQFRLVFQSDGNVVLLNKGGSVLWHTITQGRGTKAVMQTDGNFVVYADRVPIFNTGTQGKSGASLVLQNDGNLVVRHGQGSAWNSGTWGGVSARDQSSKSLLGSVVGTIGDVGKGIASVGTGLAKTVASVATSPIHLVSDIAQGKNVLESFKDTVKRDLKSAKELAPYVQAVLSVVPGVGQGVNMAIAAGSALAHGQPITDALIAGVRGALPGGPLVQQALDTAYNLSKGQNITEAALNAARNQLPPGPAQAAFNTGVALAHGQKLQTALIEHGSKLLPGGQTVQTAVQQIAGGGNVVTALAGVAKDQGMSFLSDAQKRLSPLASQAMSNVGPRIGQVTRGALTIVPTNVKQAANAMLQNPSLRSLPIATVAQRLGLPSDDVRQAVASVVQSAGRTGIGQMKPLAPATQIAERIGTHTSFDQSLARFGSRMAPIAMNPNARRLPRFRRLMPGGAMGLQNDAGAFGTIKLGSSGADVQAWQKILGITADGKFGPQTDSATRAWQKTHGLTADGVVGPKTWAAAQGGVPPAPSAPSTGPGTMTIPETVVSAAPPPPLTQAQISAAKSMPTIRLGSQGDAVKTWQGILRRDSGISGFSAVPDGKFGPVTDAATKNWQRSSGLTPDGVVGPQTWQKGIGSLTTAPLPAQSAPGVNLPTPAPPMLPPGLPPVPTQPVQTAPPLALPPILAPGPVVFTPPPFTPPPMLPPPPSIGVTTAPPPTTGQTDKAGGAVAALAIGAMAAKLFGIF